MEAVSYAQHESEIRDNSLNLLYNAIYAGFRLDEKLTVSQWADRHRYLSPKASAEPGPWRTSRVPYAQGIMDSLSSNHSAHKIIFMKGAQIAGTEIGNNFVGYVIDQAPGPMIGVLPNERMAERNSKTRIQPLIEESERLRKKVRSPRSRDSGNTVMTKEFPGGVLALVGANAPSNLRMMPCRYAFLDEVDGYPGDVGGEGDPVELVVTRTRTFPKRKIFMCSTPTIKGSSRIETEFLNSNQQRYYVPCPHCEYLQTLKFANIKYEKDDPETAHLVCEECGCIIEEHEKTWMLENGQWIAENPDADPKVVGFHLNSLYSPVGWFSWSDAVTMWELAQRDIDKLKVFINTVLAETWEERGDAPDWELLYRRRENYTIGTVPAGGLFLTAGVDVQKDRLEVEVVAWGRNKISWAVDSIVIPGDTSTDIPWQQLDEIVNSTYPHENGYDLPIQRTAVDSGYRTQKVYAYCRKHAATLRAIAVKGSDTLNVAIGSPRPMEVTIEGKRYPRGVKLWPVGVSVLKTEFYGYLAQEKPLNPQDPYPHGYCHFPEFDEAYFKQITAEHLISRKDKKGKTVREWHLKKDRDRNEKLDCRNYARAAAASLGYDRMSDATLNRLENQLRKKAGMAPMDPSSTPEPTEKVNDKRRVRRVRSKGL